ncbi:hypothetical protein [Nocardioides sp. NPDC047086]|uniref:hypothetical protein n=1 Tax=Nocardioides sp. NPDC047086 TaxID=3154810 RepID=UPI0033ECB68E
MTLHVEPAKVRSTAAAWDTENLHLTAAAKQIHEVGTGGFTPAVASLIGQFVEAWEAIATKSARFSESQADGLRSTAIDILRTDAKTDINASLVLSSIKELR